jgi:endonuclease/exonuclease/phosphatase family metal-dependent hydrolase
MCPQFAHDKGLHQLAARVKQHGPFDIIGMQECEDVNKIASELGWMDSHEWHQGSGIRGEADLGVGFNKTMFEKIGDWQAKKVAEDAYGPRYLDYIRLKHKESGGTLFLGNTHGALPWHTDCSGAGGDQKAKAYIDAVNAYIEPGDSMIVTGDFNCINRDEEIWALNATWTLACDDKLTQFDHIYMKNTTTSVSKCDDQSRHEGGGPSDHALTWADMAMLTPIKDASEVLV